MRCGSLRVHSIIGLLPRGVTCMGSCLSRFFRRALSDHDLDLLTPKPDATHCVRTVNPVPSLQDILHHLDAVRYQWFVIGLVLQIKYTKLKEIEQQYKLTEGPRRCLAEMIHHWLSSNPATSWEQVVAALEYIDEFRLAAIIKQKHVWIPSEWILVCMLQLACSY